MSFIISANYLQKTLLFKEITPNTLIGPSIVGFKQNCHVGCHVAKELRQKGKAVKIFLPQIQVLEFLKAADLSGKLFYLIVEHVQHLQVLKVSNVWRYSYGEGKQRKSKK